jgi:murein DD-endopeptidase MepM/ murein hydrolase activator NlpD
MFAVVVALALLFTPACPVQGDIEFSNDYGIYAKGRIHRGVDIYAERGTWVIAPEAGIMQTDHGRKGGKVIRLWAYDGTEYYLAHLDKHAHRFDGQHVTQGQLIGYVGNTGNARCCSPHLHFGQKENGKRVSPYPQLLEACTEPVRTGPGH